MNYDELELGKTAVVEYDQSPRDSDDEYVCRERGEVISTAQGGLVRLEERRGRHIIVDRERNEVRIASGNDSSENIYDLVDFHVESVQDHLINPDDLYDSSEKYMKGLDDVSGAIARANAAIGIVHRESDADFISEFDAWHAARVYEDGLDSRLRQHNDHRYGVGDDRAVIEFPNDVLAYIWVEEICGQISDGAWENKVRDWEQYYGAKVVVNEDLRQVNVNGNLPSLDFNGELLEYEGLPGRMMFYAIASGLGEDLTRGSLSVQLMRLQNGFVDSEGDN